MHDHVPSATPSVLLVATPQRRAELALQLTQNGARVVRASAPQDIEAHLAAGRVVGLVVDIVEQTEDDLVRLDWSEASGLRDALASAHGWPLVARATSADAASWVHSLRSTEDATRCVPAIDRRVVAWLAAARAPRPRLVGVSASMRALLAELGRAARARDSVLVTGEAGAGKLLVARSFVERIGGSPVRVECARWQPSARFEPDQVLGNLRQTAVVVLERLDALPPEHARAFGGWIDRLVERQARGAIRIVATCDFGADRAGIIERLGAKTYFRLDRCRIDVPPLRARTEDVPLLLGELARRLGAPLQLTRAEQATLARVRYEWPGNVQELRSVLARAIDDVGQGSARTPRSSAAPEDGSRAERAALLGSAVVRHFVEHVVASSGAGVWGQSLRFTRPVRERELVRALTVATVDAVGDVGMAAALLGCHEATVRAAMRVRFDAALGSVDVVDGARGAAPDPGHPAPPE